MGLSARLRALRRLWWVVPLTVVLSTVISGVATSRVAPRYATDLSFFVGAPNAQTARAYQGDEFLRQRVGFYVDLITSERLARGVAADAGVGLTAAQVPARITAVAETGTTVLRATVTDSVRSRSLRLAQALAARFPALIQEIETPTAGQSPTVRVDVLDGPRLDPTPVWPRPLRNLSLAALLGLLVGVGALVLREAADGTVRDAATLQRLGSAPVLGQIPYDRSARRAPLIVGAAGLSTRAEAFRALRTNLRFVDPDRSPRVISVTSAGAGEGRTSVACNLAICCADAGSRVLLVDADLRRPGVARHLGLDGAVGLTDVLVGTDWEEAIQPWADGPLRVLTAGSVPPNPGELLGGEAMARLLGTLRDQFDLVIIDATAVLPFADGAAVAVQADGVLFVAGQGRVPRTRVAAAVDAVRSSGAQVLGYVLTMASPAAIGSPLTPGSALAPATSLTAGSAGSPGSPVASGPASRAGHRRTDPAAATPRANGAGRLSDRAGVR